MGRSRLIPRVNVDDIGSVQFFLSFSFVYLSSLTKN